MNHFKELRELNGFKSQKELAKKLFVNQTAVSQWERGITTPNTEILKTLSSLYGVSIDYLLGISKNRANNMPVKIPVLGEVSAGLPLEAVENIIDYEEISEEQSKRGDFFALKIKGDSMEPRMKAGDVIIVKKQSTANTGDTVVVFVGRDSATVKKIKVSSDGLTLIPSNPAYEISYFTNQEINKLPVNIIGKVVELRAKF